MSQQGNEKAKKAQLNAQTDEDFRRAGARVIVFCAGGLAYSEVRSAYEVMKESGREVIIGEWTMSTNLPFLFSLSNLN